MSGELQTRVNRIWLNATQPNVTHWRAFWEFLNFFVDHPGFSIAAYGANGSQIGTGTPSSWLTWGNPVPFAQNAWFVVEADKASQFLDGSGTFQWQCKFQCADTGQFDDPSGNDYGYEAYGYPCICARLSPDGGWNENELDFVPTSGSEPDTNRLIYITYTTTNLYLHIIGDDDAIWWTGKPGPLDFHLGRGGYLGMINRRSNDIAKPCIAMLGRMSNYTAVTGIDCPIEKREDSQRQFSYGYSSGWSFYSLAPDGVSAVSGGRLDPWDSNILVNLPKFDWTDEDYVLQMMCAQYATPHFNILGELLPLIGACRYSYGEGAIFGTDGEWQQIANAPESYGGVAMRWPPGVVPLF